MDLYYFPASPGCRSVLMLAKELKIEFNLKLCNTITGETRTPEHRKLNPQHLIPVLDDDGFILGESRAIMRYLLNKYEPDSTLYPSGAVARAVIDRLLDFDCGTLAAITLQLLKDKYYYGKEINEDIISTLKEALEIFEELIARNGESVYLTGDKITLADLSILPTVNTLFTVGIHVTEYPKINRWLSSMEKLPYYEELNTIPLQPFRETC